MARTVQFTKNREFIYGLLQRGRRYHCTCSSQHRIDVTDLLQVLDAYREAGHPISIDAVLIGATSLLLRRFPRLNNHLYHGVIRKYEVHFEDISCNVILLRKDGDEMILLPLLIENSDKLSVDEINEILTHGRTTPLDQLPQVQSMQKLKRMPLIALKLFSFLARSNHRFYRKFFGTYGYSSLLIEGSRGVRLGDNGVVGNSSINTCTGFLPCSIFEEAVVVNGEIVVRKILTMTVLMDHYLVDGQDMLLATRYLDQLLRHPVRLGLSQGQSPPTASSIEAAT